MTAADRVRRALDAADPAASGNALGITEADVVMLLADRDRAQAEADHFAETGLAEQDRRVLAERRIAAAERILDDYRHGDLAPAAGLNRVRDALRGGDQ